MDDDPRADDVHYVFENETNREIIQAILSRPQYIALTDEVAYIVQQDVSEELEGLTHRGLIDCISTSDGDFWHLTQYAIQALKPLIQYRQSFQAIYEDDLLWGEKTDFERPDPPEKVVALIKSAPTEEETNPVIKQILENKKGIQEKLDELNGDD